MWKIEQRVNKLNELGFDVDELEMKTAEDGKRVLVRPRVVDAGLRQPQAAAPHRP